MPESLRFFDGAPFVAPSVTPPETLTRPEKPLTPAEQLLVAGIETVTTNAGFLNWLKVAAKFHDYSLNNQLLIAMQMPEATKVMGYRTWQEIGRQVQKGETAIKIFYPQFGVVEDEDPDTGEKRTGKVLRGFGIGNVFDVSQTEGAPLPAGPTFGDLNEPNAIAREVNLRLSRWLIDEALLLESKDFPGHAHGFYNPNKRQIVIRRSVTVDEETGAATPLVDPLNLMKTKTLVHEASHYLADHGQMTESREGAEIEAEGSSFIVLDHFGLDTSSYSWPYIAQWGGTKEQVKDHLHTIGTVAKTLIGAIEGTSDPFAAAPPAR